MLNKNESLRFLKSFFTCVQVVLIISYMKLANSKYFVLWHVFQKVLNLIFLLFSFRFLFIRVMRIEILHAFKRVESIHETQTPSYFLYF